MKDDINVVCTIKKKLEHFNRWISRLRDNVWKLVNEPEPKSSVHSFQKSIEIILPSSFIYSYNVNV